MADAQEGEHVEPPSVAEDEPDRDQEDLHGDEEAPARNVRNPKDPLPEERNLHYKRGHLPYRAWCPVCVKARGREDQHKAKKSDDQAVVKVSMDYCSVGEMKLLVGREDKSKHVFCHLCKCKGLGDDRIVDKIMRSISDTENTKIVLKTDGEPALVQVQDRIISVRTQPTIPENPPAYDPQANGGAERGVQEVKAQLRATKLGLEARIGVEIMDTMAILEWMIPQVADTINRFLVGDDGRTAYYRVRHKNFHGEVFEFGEQVLAKPKRSNKQVRNKGALEPRFHDATWVGYNDRNNEYIVVLKEGGPAIKVRTVRPKTEGERWSAIAIKDIVATPDMPNPKDDSQKDPRSERNTRGLDSGASGGQLLPKQGARHEPGLNRNFRINNRILEKYGPTMGCKGCENKMTGDDARPHSSESRARLEELMREDDVEAEIIARRDDRREQRAKVIAERNKAKDEQGSEPRTAPQPASSSSNGQQERQVEANNAKRSQMTPKNQEKHAARSKGWHA